MVISVICLVFSCYSYTFAMIRLSFFWPFAALAAAAPKRQSRNSVDQRLSLRGGAVGTEHCVLHFCVFCILCMLNFVLFLNTPPFCVSKHLLYLFWSYLSNFVFCEIEDFLCEEVNLPTLHFCVFSAAVNLNQTLIAACLSP